MKLLILASLLIGSSSLFAAETECLYHEVEAPKKVYVLPLYEAEVTYFFDDAEKDAFYKVFWSINQKRTMDCFTLAKEKFPESKLAIPTVRMDELTVSVLGADGPALPLKVVQQSNGHWIGMVGARKINYQKKAMIEKAIKDGESVIELNGDFRYRMTITERKVVEQLNCTEKGEEIGILKLYSRMGEIKKALEKLTTLAGVDSEEVLQDFMGSCVLFQNVEANSLVELDKNLRVNSRIVKGNLNVKADISKDITEPLPTITNQKINVLKY